MPVFCRHDLSCHPCLRQGCIWRMNRATQDHLCTRTWDGTGDWTKWAQPPDEWLCGPLPPEEESGSFLGPFLATLIILVILLIGLAIWFRRPLSAFLLAAWRSCIAACPPRGYNPLNPPLNPAAPPSPPRRRHSTSSEGSTTSTRVSSSDEEEPPAAPPTPPPPAPPPPPPLPPPPAQQLPPVSPEILAVAAVTPLPITPPPLRRSNRPRRPRQLFGQR